MRLVDWLAFALLVVSVGAGLVIAGLRAFATWRAFRSLRRTVFRSLGDLSRRVTGVETRLEHLAENAAKLADAQARLGRSLSTAAVLADAAGESRSAWRRLRSFVPSK